MKRFIFLSLLIILAVCTFTGCGSTNKRERVDSDIKNFSYSYGSYNGGYYDFSITTFDGIVNFRAKGMNGINLNVDKEIDQSILKDLAKVIDDNKIYEWDGFDKSDDSVLDGYSFHLKIEYENGEVIEARGYMEEPDDYDNGHKKITDFLKTLE